MKEPTLVVLAAGMGSRYGGLKQIDPVGKNGEIIIDYSVYDALRAGFKKVVFLIRESMREDIERIIGRHVAQHAEVRYVYQEFEKFLPEGFVIPEGRTKPWGTGHAILCCRDVVDGPFAMINSDDYYGPHAFQQIYEALCAMDDDTLDFAMVGYRLGNTLTDHGKVARGVCEAEDGQLRSIVERTYVVKTPEGPKYSTDGGKTLVPVPEDSTVSMNFWGFTSRIFDELETRFPLWLSTTLQENPTGEEMYIPNVVGQLLREGLATVRVMRSEDRWYGVTYKEDKPAVQQAMSALVEQGLYPERLWEAPVTI